jgi:hypothetical protein
MSYVNITLMVRPLIVRINVKQALFILTVVMMTVFAHGAQAYEATGVSVKTENRQIVEIVIPSDATDADLAMLAEKLNTIEPSEGR